jgi:NDP-sugar pyrophosphorylase family protein
MIFAAGLGTRFKPWTDRHPKALAPVHGKSLLQRNIEYLQQYGIDEVVVNVHHFAEQIEEAIKVNDGWGSKVLISDERDTVLETGGGLMKARQLLGEDDFVVINVDVLTDLDLGAMIRYHKSKGSLATLAVSDRITSRYFLFDKEMELRGWRNISTGEERLRAERPEGGQNAGCNTQRSAPSLRPVQPGRSAGPAGVQPKAFSGIHIISPKLFQHIHQQGKFSMVDVYLSLGMEYPVYGFDHTGSKFIDVGKPDSVEKAEGMFAAG